MERFFKEATGLSAELDQHSRRLLRSYGNEWKRLPGENRTDGSASCGKRGFSIGFDLSQRFPDQRPGVGQMPCSRSWSPIQVCPMEQATAWRRLLGEPWELPNPQTDWTATDLHRLPGQIEFAALLPVVGHSYAEQLIRILDVHPELLSMTIYRPSDHHRNQDHRRQKPSPIAAFIHGASWVPLSSGGFSRVNKAWFTSEARTPRPVCQSLILVFAHCSTSASKQLEYFRMLGYRTMERPLLLGTSLKCLAIWLRKK